MHTVYTTEGFVLKSLNFGEANKCYFILTKDFGLVKATAQGVRLLKSKLRYNLDDLSAVQISMVRGKDIWRITSAHAKTKLNHPIILPIFSLLLRLLHGEERNDFLYETIKEGISFLDSQKLSSEQLSNLECILALRILSSLGYIGNLGDFNKFTESPYFTVELLSTMSAIKTRAILEINRSLKETQL